MEQLGYTVSQMHAAGLTWARVDPDNMVIDMEDNLWIIPGSHPWEHEGKYDGWEASEIERAEQRAKDEDLRALEEFEERFW